MFKYAVMAIAAASMVTACSPIRSTHGFQPDEIEPREIQPGEDTRSTVLSRLGTPSTQSIFDNDTYFYITSRYEAVAFLKPKISSREITAISFGEGDIVDEVVQYDADDGEILRYAARETATRGRQLGLLEQLFGNVGAIRLPNSGDQVPGQIPGQ